MNGIALIFVSASNSPKHGRYHVETVHMTDITVTFGQKPGWVIFSICSTRRLHSKVQSSSCRPNWP